MPRWCISVWSRPTSSTVGLSREKVGYHLLLREDFKSLHKGGDGMFTIDELVEDVPNSLMNGIVPVVPPVKRSEASRRAKRRRPLDGIRSQPGFEIIRFRRRRAMSSRAALNCPSVSRARTRSRALFYVFERFERGRVHRPRAGGARESPRCARLHGIGPSGGAFSESTSPRIEDLICAARYLRSTTPRRRS